MLQSQWWNSAQQHCTLLIALHINASYYVHRDVHRDVHHGALRDDLHDDLDQGMYGWWILEEKEEEENMKAKNIWGQKENDLDNLCVDHGESPLQP